MSSQTLYSSESDYTLPLVFAVAVHLLAAVLFFGNIGLQSTPKRADFELPSSIKASVVQIEQVVPPEPVVQQAPKPEPKPAPVAQPKPQPVKAEPKPEEPAPKPVEPAPKPVEPAPVETSVPSTLQVPEKPAEPVAVEPAPDDTEVISEAELLDNFLAELEAEDRAIEQQLAAIEAENERAAQVSAAVANYTQLITQQIQQRWSRPAELRLMDLSNIQAIVAVQLLPTGELDSATIIEASGLATYDQSVLRAIERVRRFEVPEDSDLFEAGGFRRLTITFRPEDLM